MVLKYWQYQLKNLNLILLSLWCFTKIPSDLLLSGCQHDGNASKCSTTATKMTKFQELQLLLVHLPPVWQNIKGNWSDWFMVIYESLLTGESWNNPQMPLKIFSISHPVALTPDWKAPWMTWSPQEPTSNIWGTSSQLWMFFNFSCTDQLIFGQSIESIDRLFVGRFVVAFKSFSKMLSAFGRLKNLQWKYLLTASFAMSSQNQIDISNFSFCNLLFKLSWNESE